MVLFCSEGVGFKVAFVPTIPMVMAEIEEDPLLPNEDEVMIDVLFVVVEVIVEVVELLAVPAGIVVELMEDIDEAEDRVGTTIPKESINFLGCWRHVVSSL